MQIDRGRRTRSEDMRHEFESLFREYHVEVLAFALRRADSMTAHDAAAEAFAVAWRRWDDLPKSQPLPWLYGVTRRVLANMRRREHHQLTVASRWTTSTAGRPAANAAEDEMQLTPAIRAFAALRERDQEALRLIAWEELTAREAADALGVSDAAFRVRLHRARNRFATALEAIGESPGAGDPNRQPRHLLAKEDSRG